MRNRPLAGRSSGCGGPDLTSSRDAEHERSNKNPGQGRGIVSTRRDSNPHLPIR